AVHPIALRERQEGIQVKRLTVLLKMVDEPADDRISRRLRSQILEVANQDDVMARSADSHVEKPGSVLLDAHRMEETSEPRAERIGEVEHHRRLLVALETVDRSGDTRRARAETVLKKRLDQPGL